jgi:hypothetical protein
MKDSQAREDILSAHHRIGTHSETLINLRGQIDYLQNKVAHHEKVLNLLFTHLGLEIHSIPEVPAVPAIPAHLGIRKAAQVRDDHGRFAGK